MGIQPQPISLGTIAKSDAVRKTIEASYEGSGTRNDGKKARKPWIKQEGLRRLFEIASQYGTSVEQDTKPQTSVYFGKHPANPAQEKADKLNGVVGLEEKQNTERPPDYGEKNKIFTKDSADKVREVLRKKFGTQT
jgi:hypothetical protein